MTGSPLGGAEFGTPAYFNGSVYFGGVGSTIRAFSITNGLLSTTPTSQSANTFGYPGSTVSISSNGTANGIVWAAENGDVAALHAYNAANLRQELYNSNQAARATSSAPGTSSSRRRSPTATFTSGRPTVSPCSACCRRRRRSPPHPAGLVAADGPGRGVRVADVLCGRVQPAGGGRADTASGESSLTYTWSVVSTPARGADAGLLAERDERLEAGRRRDRAAGTYEFRVTIDGPRRPNDDQRRGDHRDRPAAVLHHPAFAGTTRTLGAAAAARRPRPATRPSPIRA